MDERSCVETQSSDSNPMINNYSTNPRMDERRSVETQQSSDETPIMNNYSKTPSMNERRTVEKEALDSTPTYSYSKKPKRDEKRGVENHNGETLTVLGCGSLGISILSGIIQSLRDNTNSSNPSPLPAGTPRHFIACVTRPSSGDRISTSLGPLKSSLEVLVSNNLQGVRSASVVLLACKPYQLGSILSEPGIAKALRGKFLISILAGVPVAQIQQVLHTVDPDPPEPCTVARVMPNAAAGIRESMTVIATSVPPLPNDLYELVTWIFTSIGRVVHLPPATMDASTALCASGPAFFALMLESMADGAVAMGLPRTEAQFMAAQTMRGCASLVLDGEHPAMVRERVCTPGGCSIGGLMVLEDGKVRGTLARWVREATVLAAGLGKGVQGVQGQRS